MVLFESSEDENDDEWGQLPLMAPVFATLNGRAARATRKAKKMGDLSSCATLPHRGQCMMGEYSPQARRVSRAGLVHGASFNRAAAVGGYGGIDGGDSDMWYDMERFQLDHINEVLEKLAAGAIDDEIWGKIVVMERCKRVAKAYLRKTTIIVDGGVEEFDGKTIGFNYFVNPLRDTYTQELRTKIGDGVIIKMDHQGNIKAMARGATPVYVQGWKEPRGNSCLPERIVRLQGRLSTLSNPQHGIRDEDRVVKIFDMRRFKAAVERENGQPVPQTKDLLMMTCVRLSLVKDGGGSDPMKTPCWFMIINLVALDMLKTKLPQALNNPILYARPNQHHQIYGSEVALARVNSQSSLMPPPPDIYSTAALGQILAAALQQASVNSLQTTALVHAPPLNLASPAPTIASDHLVQLAKALNIGQQHGLMSNRTHSYGSDSDESRSSLQDPIVNSLHTMCTSSSTDSSRKENKSKWNPAKSIDSLYKTSKQVEDNEFIEKYLKNIKQKDKAHNKGAIRTTNLPVGDLIEEAPAAAKVKQWSCASTTSDYDSNREPFDSGSWSSASQVSSDNSNPCMRSASPSSVLSEPELENSSPRMNSKIEQQQLQQVRHSNDLGGTDSAPRHSTNSNKPEKASVDLCISENLLSNRENPLDGPSSVSISSTAASAVSKPRYQHRVGESADMLPPATVNEQQIEQDDPLDVDPMDDDTSNDQYEPPTFNAPTTQQLQLELATATPAIARGNCSPPAVSRQSPVGHGPERPATTIQSALQHCQLIAATPVSMPVARFDVDRGCQAVQPAAPPNSTTPTTTTTTTTISNSSGSNNRQRVHGTNFYGDGQSTIDVSATKQRRPPRTIARELQRGIPNLPKGIQDLSKGIPSELPHLHLHRSERNPSDGTRRRIADGARQATSASPGVWRRRGPWDNMQQRQPHLPHQHQQQPPSKGLVSDIGSPPISVGDACPDSRLGHDDRRPVLLAKPVQQQQLQQDDRPFGRNGYGDGGTNRLAIASANQHQRLAQTTFTPRAAIALSGQQRFTPGQRQSASPPAFQRCYGAIRRGANGAIASGNNDRSAATSLDKQQRVFSYSTINNCNNHINLGQCSATPPPPAAKHYQHQHVTLVTLKGDEEEELVERALAYPVGAALPLSGGVAVNSGDRTRGCRSFTLTRTTF